VKGSARAWQIQRWIFKANHWAEYGVPNGGVRNRIGGPKEVSNPIGRIPQSFQALNAQQESTCGATHDSSYICRRGWPFWKSVGGETIGPLKLQCFSVVECQEGKQEWVGMLEHPQRSRGGSTFSGFLEWKLGKGITFEL